MFDMRRREFITLLGGVATVAPRGVRSRSPLPADITC
jgi:hypothetical protein